MIVIQLTQSQGIDLAFWLFAIPVIIGITVHHFGTKMQERKVRRREKP